MPVTSSYPLCDVAEGDSDEEAPYYTGCKTGLNVFKVSSFQAQIPGVLQLTPITFADDKKIKLTGARASTTGTGQIENVIDGNPFTSFKSGVTSHVTWF